MSFIRTLSSNESVALRAPSGRPNGKQYLKFVIWNSRSWRRRSFISENFSFSSCVILPTPSGLKQNDNLLCYFADLLIFSKKKKHYSTYFHVRDSRRKQTNSGSKWDQSYVVFQHDPKDRKDNTNVYSIPEHHIGRNIRPKQILVLD